MKIVLFDFCETLVNYQTADYFVEYTLKKHNRGKMYYAIAELGVIKKLLGKHWRIKKKLHLLQMKGLSKQDIEDAAKEYYIEYVKPNSFPYMRSLINEYKDKGYMVYIVSGGYSPYIRMYAEELMVDDVIANDFSYNKRGKFKGHIIRKDCMELEKIVRLDEYFADKDIQESISYSDSLSDLPMLKWTQRGVLVSKYKERKSAKDNKLEQIVLHDVEKQVIRFEFSGLKG